MLRILCLILFLFPGVSSSNDNASHEVFWAGFSYTGSQSSRSETAKYSSLAITKNGILELNKSLYQSLVQNTPTNLKPITNELAALDGSTSAKVFSLALDRELVSIEPIAGKNKILIEVVLQVLFFDFLEKQVISSYPITIQRIDISEKYPSDDEIIAMFEDIFYGKDDNDISYLFASTIKDIKLPNSSLRRLQVGEISFSDEAAKILPPNLGLATVKSTLANEFTKILTSSTGVGLLPPSIGEAIGGAMSLRFSDQKVFNLKIPETDYLVNLSVDRFATKILEETPAMRNLLFGAVFKVSVIEPFSGKVFFDQNLKKGGTKVVPASQSYIDVWASSYETLLSGLDFFSNAISGRSDEKWIDGQIPGGKILKAQIKQTKELVESCKY